MPRVQLNADASALRRHYESADPFAHIVIDGLFDERDLDRVVAEFPKPDETKWVRFDNPQEKKLGFFHESSVISDTVRVSSTR